MLLEDFKNALPEKMVVFLNEQKVTSLAKFPSTCQSNYLKFGKKTHAKIKLVKVCFHPTALKRIKTCA